MLGGGSAAQSAAALAALAAPMLCGLTATLNTTTLEPLAWTAVAYLLARAQLDDDRRALLGAGLVAGLALEAKYALGVWLLALGAGIALTGARQLYARRELWLGLALTVILALPSVLWQAAHGWPFVELVHNAGAKNVAASPLGALANQVLVMDPLFAPLWLAGIAAPFVRRDLAAARFLAIAFLGVAAVLLATPAAKDYYLAAAYPTVFAIGAVAFEHAVRNAFARAAYLAAAVVVGAIGWPLALPILDPPILIAYERAIHLAPVSQERVAAAPLPSTFADMLGWHDFTGQVAAAWRAIPARERGATSILVDNYGEAAALDAYGGPYGLPPALSGHNEYYLWGLRGERAVNVLRVQVHVERLRRYCRTVRVLGTTFSRYAMPYENGQSIAFCEHVAPPLRTVWPRLKSYE